MSRNKDLSIGGWIGGIVATVLFLGVFGAAVGFGCPIYKVWSQEKEGEAEFKRAEQNRKIKIEEAKAKYESSKSLALAEVERAKGVAKANEIIGTSLKNNEAYLRYLWIQGLQDGSSEVIYIPTEGNMPILEAGRFGKPAKKFP